MANNKVIYDGTTLIDLTSDTVTPDTLLTGATAHDASGAQITGTATGGGDLSDITTNITGLLKGAGGKVTQAEGGIDYAAPADVSGAVSGHNSAGNAHSTLFAKKQNSPALASSLPASGTALTANTIYAVADAVGTYAFTPPESGWAHGMFSTDTSVSVSFSGNFAGVAPTIEASKTYEFDVLNGVWAVQEVVSA